MTYLAVFGIPLAVAVVGWKVLDFIDEMLHYSRTYRDPFSRQLDEIRSLPEVPYDRDRDVA